MKQFAIISIASLALFFSCMNKKENERLLMENEELQIELARAQMAANTLEEVGVLLDSIDKTRKALELDIESGTKYNDYVARMNDLNNYVISTEEKILSLEKELEKSADKNKSYLRTISRLKQELSVQNEEIQHMKVTIDKYKNENTDLLKMVDVQETQIMDLEDEISMKKEELELIENRIQELMKKSQMTEADSYFALGEALEEAAKRKKLAPKKRKETYKEAIEIYKKALAFGREDAQEKIDELENKI